MISRFFRKKRNFDLISRILSDSSMRERFLGVDRRPPMSPERAHESTKASAGHIIRHTTTEDYSEWAKEAWDELLSYLDRIIDPKTDGREVDFCRGAMSSIIDLLRVSYRAIEFQQREADKRKNQEKATNLRQI